MFAASLVKYVAVCLQVPVCTCPVFGSPVQPGPESQALDGYINPSTVNNRIDDNPPKLGNILHTSLTMTQTHNDTHIYIYHIHTYIIYYIILYYIILYVHTYICVCVCTYVGKCAIQ